MAKEMAKTTGGHASPFEWIKRTNDAGMEFWSIRDFAVVLAYGDYRNFEGVIEKAKLSCFNSGHRLEDHFVDVTEMVAIGSGAERSVKTIIRVKSEENGEWEERWTGDYIFENEWQSFRTKKNRALELKSVFHECEPGRRKLAVKVVDIFGNDTMTIVEVAVGGKK